MPILSCFINLLLSLRKTYPCISVKAVKAENVNTNLCGIRDRGQLTSMANTRNSVVYIMVDTFPSNEQPRFDL